MERSKININPNELWWRRIWLSTPNLINNPLKIILDLRVVDKPTSHGQDRTHTIFLAVAFISIPILLLTKPYYLSNETEAEAHGEDEEGGDREHGDGFGEIVIHQTIELIN